MMSREISIRTIQLPSQRSAFPVVWFRRRVRLSSIARTMEPREAPERLRDALGEPCDRFACVSCETRAPNDFGAAPPDAPPRSLRFCRFRCRSISPEPQFLDYIPICRFVNCVPLRRPPRLIFHLSQKISRCVQFCTSGRNQNRHDGP